MIEENLQALIEQITTDETLALTLTGSYARGDATPYSDMDLHHYVTQPADRLDKYRLSYADDTLVTVSTITIEAKREELQAPETAIWAVEGLRQSKILIDPTGAFAALQAEAHAFVWDADMQQKADAYASRQLMDFGEEALKICGGLVREDDSAVLYGTVGIVLGLSALILTQHGILLRTENEYFRQAREVIAGFDALKDFDTAQGGVVGSARMRGEAALRYYVKTAKHLDSIIQPEHRSVIETTVHIITRES